MAIRKIRFTGSLRLRYDDNGTTSETTSKYPVVSHWTVDVLIWNSPIRIGNSTFIKVSVRMPMNAMIPVAKIERIKVRGIGSGCVIWVFSADMIGAASWDCCSAASRFCCCSVMHSKAVPSFPFLVWTAQPPGEFEQIVRSHDKNMTDKPSALSVDMHAALPSYERPWEGSPSTSIAREPGYSWVVPAHFQTRLPFAASRNASTSPFPQLGVLDWNRQIREAMPYVPSCHVSASGALPARPTRMDSKQTSVTIIRRHHASHVMHRHIYPIERDGNPMHRLRDVRNTGQRGTYSSARSLGNRVSTHRHRGGVRQSGGSWRGNP